MFFICLLQLLPSLTGLLRRGGWAWFFRVAKDQAVTLTTLVRINFLLLVTEFQACTFSQGMWGIGIPLSFTAHSGIALGILQMISPGISAHCRTLLYYTGIRFASWWQTVVRRQHLLSHAHLDLFTHRKLSSFPKEILVISLPYAPDPDCYPR